METNFKAGDPGSVKILSEELERKIEEVNASMVNARNETERFQAQKNQLEEQIKNLQEKVKVLSEEVPLLQDQKSSLKSDLISLDESINERKIESSDLKKQNEEIKASNKEESDKLVLEKAAIEKRKTDLDAQEATLRVYGKGLEEKERKLDIYADRVKKLLDSVKP